MWNSAHWTVPNKPGIFALTAAPSRRQSKKANSRTVIASTYPLQQNELFGALTEAELSRISALCSDFVAIEDATVFTAGRNASHLYLVAQGQIALQRSIRVPHATRPRRTPIVICRPGDIVGWSALVEPYKYTLSAVAWQSSRLIRIDSATLRKALRADPEMGYKVMISLSAVMGRRLNQTTSGLINEREASIIRDIA